MDTSPTRPGYSLSALFLRNWRMPIWPLCRLRKPSRERSVPERRARKFSASLSHWESGWATKTTWVDRWTAKPDSWATASAWRLTRFPVLGPVNHQIQSNMTIAVEPKMIYPSLGVVGIEDTFLTTAGGAQRLTRLPQEIWRV